MRHLFNEAGQMNDRARVDQSLGLCRSSREIYTRLVQGGSVGQRDLALVVRNALPYASSKSYLLSQVVYMKP